MEDLTDRSPTEADLDALRSQIATVMKTGANETRKGLVNALVQEIRVESRNAIQPVLKVPAGSATTATDGAVRPPSGLVGAEGLEPPTSAL